MRLVLRSIPVKKWGDTSSGQSKNDVRNIRRRLYIPLSLVAVHHILGHHYYKLELSVRMVPIHKMTTSHYHLLSSSSNTLSLMPMMVGSALLATADEDATNDVAAASPHRQQQQHLFLLQNMPACTYDDIARRNSILSMDRYFITLVIGVPTR